MLIMEIKIILKDKTVYDYGYHIDKKIDMKLQYEEIKKDMIDFIDKLYNQEVK